MNKKGRDAFAIAEALADDGRLVSHELITINDDIIPTVKQVQVSSEFLTLLLSRKKVYNNQRDTKNYDANSDNCSEPLKTAASRPNKLSPQQEQFCETDRPENTTGSARRPLLKPEQLVLSDKVSSALEMCVIQAQNAETLFDNWGLKETIPYGEAVVMMFSGPAGTGKTACAEAVAYQLNKPIMVVNYAEVQNYLAGQTQKNIVRIFAEAEQTNAVLFWDEADSFFCDRDSASQNWEVREVNVLLQELERFHGVCILSTNRRTALDKALERRVNIKVQFERPDRDSRRKIWEKLTPTKMPLAEDVSFDKLSSEDLSGGEIKNVVLNAARLALKNGRKKGPVTMNDFQQAIQIENEGRWNIITGKFGFNK